MSYLALARKWRPRKFSEVVGQTHVLTALENALDQNRLHHAYLFSGTRGVGKTSIGRLFAKGLNCETGITSTPCGTCSTCIEIDEGRSVDLLEIDAASRTKVEDTRELLDNVQYKPARNRFKVYLIDEVHMLSRHSFNALLKTLEEPPEYVKFLLATTDPQKLPMTILSRCLQFHLKPITVENIQQQLDHILEKEQVQSESRALALLAHAADGSMRDALSLTDQAIALGNGNVSTPVVSQMLGTLDTAQAIQILESLTTGDAHQVMTKLEHLAENGVDWDTLLSELALQLHRIAMTQALPSSIDAAIADSEKIQHLARTLQATDVQLYYQIALKGRQDLPFAPSQRVAVEMTLLRMLHLDQALSSALMKSLSRIKVQWLSLRCHRHKAWQHSRYRVILMLKLMPRRRHNLIVRVNRILIPLLYRWVTNQYRPNIDQVRKVNGKHLHQIKSSIRKHRLRKFSPLQIVDLMMSFAVRHSAQFQPANQQDLRVVYVINCARNDNRLLKAKRIQETLL